MAKSLIETLLDDFWLLSLSLEQALEDDDWDQVIGLLQRREEVLRTLECLEPDPAWLPKLRRAMDADRRCQELVQRKQRALLMELEEESQQRRCGDHYRPTPTDPPHHFESEG
jgi:hypothetical protein